MQIISKNAILIVDLSRWSAANCELFLTVSLDQDELYWFLECSHSVKHRVSVIILHIEEKPATGVVCRHEPAAELLSHGAWLSTRLGRLVLAELVKVSNRLPW